MHQVKLWFFAVLLVVVSCKQLRCSRPLPFYRLILQGDYFSRSLRTSRSCRASKGVQ